MTTPGKPRQSSIPGPRASGLPTPGRSRSSSSVYHNPILPPPAADIDRAFAAAVKANDPALHRAAPISASSSSNSLSPQSLSYSGRRSVVGARPSSAASSSSTGVRVPERAKTPVSTRATSRPPSRQSDAFTKPPKSFEIGDNVRIESRGFEGTLRYVGEIDGKLGLWAGVELSGGFAGKGKNNGSFEGKQYFSCPPNCGVFVATTKLSPPTVGPGAVPRPSSVASNRGGRTTPAPTGRTTPSFFSSTTRTPSASFSNGRVTPSNGGRITPSSGIGRVTPGAGLTKRTLKTPTAKPPAKPNGASLADKITAGSRASKYLGMTAQQLSSRDAINVPDSPTRRTTGLTNTMLTSPIMQRTLSSPSRPSTGSPFSTPRAPSAGGRLAGVTGNTASPSLPSSRGGRPSMSTPRARIPSAVAMPPPPSPKSVLLNLQNHQPHSSASMASSVSPLPSTSRHSSSRPSSSTSFRSQGTDELSLVEQLQSRLDALEYENERLRVAAESAVPTKADTKTDAETSTIEPPSTPTEVLELRERLEEEKQNSADQVSTLEKKFNELQQEFDSRVSQLEDVQNEKLSLAQQVKEAHAELEQVSVDKQLESDTHATALKELENRNEDLETLLAEKERQLSVQSHSIEGLKGDLQKVIADFEIERKHLGANIDELRIAGQETIALYEEKLSAADSARYELQSRVSSLEARTALGSSVSGSERPSQPSISMASQIDNETLQEQVIHLQSKINMLEDLLEKANIQLEQEAQTFAAKLERVKQDDEQRRRDLLSKTREVEQLLKSEANARAKVDEVEEALRESTVALENARGEVETLRAELANIDLLIDDMTEGDISSRLAHFTKRVSSERAQFQRDLKLLEEKLSESTQNASQDLAAQNSELRSQVINMQSRITELLQAVEDRTIENDGLRKSVNRTASLANGVIISPKSEASAVKEEVAGLKHIVQELQKENLASTQRIKLLESENQLLTDETEQLRQEVHILEEGMNESMNQETDIPESVSTNDVDGLQRQMKAQRIKSETEIDQLRKRLSEAEMKHARIVHDLNKEMSELETLVESKIYREDELEQEVERLKEKVARHKKSSKGSSEMSESRHRLSTASTSTTGSDVLLGGRKDEDVCEICERPGHDIFNCSLLKEDRGGELFCEDCEGRGHVAADCPNALDVF